MGATNRPEILDPALLRPGRFDRRIVVNHPDVKGREGILGVHTRKIPLESTVTRPTLQRPCVFDYRLVEVFSLFGDTCTVSCAGGTSSRKQGYCTPNQ